MSLETKEILSFLGSDAADLDAFKAEFGTKYIPISERDKAVGEIAGKTQHSITKAAKDMGIELTKDELKDKPLHEIPSILAEKVKGRFIELEAGKSATAQEIEAKFTEKISGYEKKLADIKALNDTTAQAFEAYKTDVATKEKTRTVGEKFDTAFGGLSFAQSVNDMTKVGFKSVVRERYTFDVAEDGSEVVLSKDGKQVPSKAKAGTFATFAEVLNDEFKSQPGLAAVADSKKVPTFGPSMVIPSVDTKPVRQVAARH